MRNNLKAHISQARDKREILLVSIMFLITNKELYKYFFFLYGIINSLEPGGPLEILLTSSTSFESF